MGFFFFKQKTAYELRISDWSSDVCSSDLIVAGVEHVISALALHNPRRLEEARQPFDDMLGAYGRYHVARQFHAAQLPESSPVNIGPAVVFDQHRRFDILNIIRLLTPLRDDRSGGMGVAAGAERRLRDRPDRQNLVQGKDGSDQ